MSGASVDGSLAHWFPDRHMRRAAAARAAAAARTPDPVVAPGVVKTAIYARVSDIRQKRSGLEDQARTCRLACAASIAPARVIVAEHSDFARTGATTEGRDGFANLLAEAELRLCDEIMVASLDRLSRSMRDLHVLRKDLAALGITIREAARELDDGTFAVAAERAETERDTLMRRSLEGRFIALDEGRLPFDCAYGYMLDTHSRGAHVPHPARSATVKRIFAARLAGEGLEEIAASLDGPTPGDCIVIDRGGRPGGESWDGVIVARVLANPVYRGVVLDGRTTLARDPLTERVLGFIGVPPEKWRCVYMPRLRIATDEDWERAQNMRDRCFGRRRKQGSARRVTSRRVLCALCGHAAVDVPRTRGKPHLELKCPTAGCAGFGRAPIADVDRVALECGRRFLDGVIERRPARAAASARWPGVSYEDLDRERRGLAAELTAAPAGASKPYAGGDEPERGHTARRRLATLERFLDPYRRDDGQIGLYDTSRAFAIGLRDGTHLEAPRKGALFRGFQRVCACIVVSALGNDRWRLDCSFDAAAVSEEGGLQVVSASVERSVDGAVLASKERAASAAAAGRTSLHDLDDALRAALDRVPGALGSALASHGWTLSTLVESVVLATATGVVPAAFAEDRRDGGGGADRAEGVYGSRGGREGLVEAVRLVRDGGERCAIAALLRGRGGLLSRVPEILFARAGAFTGLAPEIEAMLDPAVVGRLRTAGGECEDPTLDRLAEWLDRSRVAGVAARYGLPQLDLTLALFRLRVHGLESCFGPARDDVGEAFAELDTGLASISGDDRRSDDGVRRIDCVRRHLKGASYPAIARATGVNYYTASNAIHRFRAAGTVGLDSRTRKTRLEPCEVDALIALVRGGVDPRDAAQPISCIVLSQVCAERFGKVASASNLAAILQRRGIAMERDAGAVPRGGQARIAEIVSSLRIIDTD